MYLFGASIDHECVIEDYCHIALGVNIIPTMWWHLVVFASR